MRLDALVKTKTTHSLSTGETHLWHSSRTACQLIVGLVERAVLRKFAMYYLVPGDLWSYPPRMYKYILLIVYRGMLAVPAPLKLKTSVQRSECFAVGQLLAL